MSGLPNLIYVCNVIPKSSYFVDTYKLILMFIWKSKRPTIVNTILKEDNKGGRLTLPNLKSYYKAIGIKTVWYW